MKIGILAYHAACNYGAFLQLLSTIEYVKKQGDTPRVINWIPKDFRKDYERRSLREVRDLYAKLREEYFPMTRLCETDKQVADIIEEESIDAVIIGSDAVLQQHPFRERVHFPCRRIIYISHPTSDRMYPNCFWGSFSKHLNSIVPIAVISGSSQDSKYYYIKGKLKSKMEQTVKSFKYISVRDDWTQKMISYLTNGNIIPDITPDPVFALNHNASDMIPSKDYIVNKFHIPDNYIILSFKGAKSVNQAWIDDFQKVANAKGLACVKLPYADAPAFGNIQYSVGNVITPLEWYALIKYSKGYVGNNMHPIVSAIANGVPFFSFDNYGIKSINGKPTNGESSKIYHILKTAGLLQYRVYVDGMNYFCPDPMTILNYILSFNVDIENEFAIKYYEKYQKMMNHVYNAIKI